MRKHTLEIVDSIKRDRISGFSILQLTKKYTLPKTTVWHYIKDIQLSKEARVLTRVNQGGSKERSEREWARAQIEASRLLKGFNIDEAWPVLFAALYWAEGTKRSGFVFTNTDENMIRVFLKIIRENLQIRNDELDILIRTSTPMDSDACRKHWSNVTLLTENEIRINHDAIQNKSKSQYGICRITLRKGGFHLKLAHCLIRVATDKMLGVPLL